LISAGNARQLVMDVAGWSTDMLRIYYNQPESLAANTIKFLPRPDSDRTHVQEEPGKVVKSA
jgi:hypothetical protein